MDKGVENGDTNVERTDNYGIEREENERRDRVQNAKGETS